MILPYLLKNSDLSGLLRFVTPNFLKVVPLSVLLKLGTRLKQNQADHAAWESLLAHSTAVVKTAGLNSLGPSSRNFGEGVLTLFFHQILQEETWILDFRAAAFAARSDEGISSLNWQPEGYYYRFPPDFVKDIRSLYCGFYLSNDSQFEEALQGLGLILAKKSLKRHFGEGDQSRVEFKLKTFQSTFADVFETCASEKIQLRPEFFVLGLMLIGLYETLEGLGLPLDVRGSFMLALQKAQKP